MSGTKLVTVVEFSTKKPYLSCMTTWDIVVCMQHGDVGLFLQVRGKLSLPTLNIPTLTRVVLKQVESRQGDRSVLGPWHFCH